LLMKAYDTAYLFLCWLSWCAPMYSVVPGLSSARIAPFRSLVLSPDSNFGTDCHHYTASSLRV
jgi:hypothetical protein